MKKLVVRCFSRVVSVVALVVLVLTPQGCMVRAQQLRSQPLITSKTIPNELQSDKKFLVYPLVDRRGPHYGKTYPSTFIPIVELFHFGFEHYYPESTGILTSNQGGMPTVSVGDFPNAFPYMLAGLMREMRFTSNVTPVDQINAKVNLQSFDYVVMGAVKTTAFEQHVNLIPLAIFAWIGAPYIFVDYSMEYELSLYRSNDMNEPIMTKTYTFEGKRAVGLYYNHSAYFDLFIGALEKTIPKAVKDMAKAIQ